MSVVQAHSHLKAPQGLAEFFTQLHIDLPLLNAVLSEPLADEAALSEAVCTCGPASNKSNLARTQ